jgi:hypothetical protein
VTVFKLRLMAGPLLAPLTATKQCRLTKYIWARRDSMDMLGPLLTFPKIRGKSRKQEKRRGRSGCSGFVQLFLVYAKIMPTQKPLGWFLGEAVGVPKRQFSEANLAMISCPAYIQEKTPPSPARSAS